MTTARSFIIGGVPRSGKTMLAKRLQKETGISLISNDYLISALEGIFPQLNIRHGEQERNATSAIQFPFINAYMNLHSDWGDQRFVLDTTHLLPKQVAENNLHEKYKVIFLGYPQISVEKKLAQIRMFPESKNDWTHSYGDDEMRTILSEMIVFGQFIEKECKKYAIPFFDTSENFNAVLDHAAGYLKTCDNYEK